MEAKGASGQTRGYNVHIKRAEKVSSELVHRSLFGPRAVAQLAGADPLDRQQC